MALVKKKKTQVVEGLVALGLLTAVGAADYVTGSQISVFPFYLAPILFVRRWAGQQAAFSMVFLCALVGFAANMPANEHLPDLLKLFWETGLRLAILLMVVVLIFHREELQLQVQQRSEKLRLEIESRVRLEKELLEIAEAEQRRIGQNLHDSLGQHLTGAALAGKVLAKKLSDKAVPEFADANGLVRMMEEAMETTRKLARSLHPIELDSDGLAGALQTLAVNISQTFNIDCRFESSGDASMVGTDVSGHLFRIAQEAVSNAIRHGRATQVTISLQSTGKSLLLAITDNGSGLPVFKQQKQGMGLRIMDYRARMIGAKFDIQNLPAGGARAVCILHPEHSETEFYAAKK